MEQKKSQNWKSYLKNFLFGIGIFYIAISPIVFFLIGNSKEPSVFLIISGVLLVVLSRFEDVSELGLFGLKAKLEKALKEAYATIEQVKEFARISATISLSHTALRRVGGVSDAFSMEMLQQSRDALKSLGCSEKELAEVTKNFHDFYLREYSRALMIGDSSEPIPKPCGEECFIEWNELVRRPMSPPINPEELEEFLLKYSFMTEENKKRLNDYAYYFEHKEFRNFEDFENRANWPTLIAVDCKKAKK